jgi:hypothetical protein
MSGGAAQADGPGVSQCEPAGAAWSTVQKLVQTFQVPAATLQIPAKAAKHLAGKHSIELALANLPMNDLIDFKQIAMRSLGKSDWLSLSDDQKQDLTATIEALVQNRYYPRWKKIFGNGAVTYVSQSRRDGDIFVSTNLRLGHKDEALIWQLSGVGSRPKVISLAVNENDLLTKLAGRIRAHQARGGYTAMVAWLKGKGKSDIANGDMSQPTAADLTSLKTSAKSIDLID